MPRAHRVVALSCLALAAAGCSNCGKPGNGGGGGSPDADAPDVYSIKLPGDGAVLNATPTPTASVEAMVNPDHLPAYDGPTGAVEGTVRVVGDPPVPTPADFSRCPDAEKIWGASFREGPPDAKGARVLADAVVVVTGYTDFYVPETLHAQRIVIEGCGFKQRTATLTFGQELDVANESKDFWTPMLEPGNNRVMRMATPHGDAVPLYPKKPGRYLVIDRERRYVDVDVFVFKHPLHGVTDREGHYRIDRVPVGKLTVSTTHPRFDGAAKAEIDVRPNVVHTIDLVLKHVHVDAGPAPLSAQPSDAGRPLVY